MSKMTSLEEKIKDIIFDDLSDLCGKTNCQVVLDYVMKEVKSELSAIAERIQKFQYECHCGCNFGAACLCKEERRGFNKGRDKALEVIRGRTG